MMLDDASMAFLIWIVGYWTGCHVMHYAKWYDFINKEED
jgi:hypothetical protein